MGVASLRARLVAALLAQGRPERWHATHHLPEPWSPAVATSEAMVAELRVHGVSGTPPESMLASADLRYPTAVRKAGDDSAGFYRREYQDGRPWCGLEAYSWGGLTSGGQLRALWLLLTPFLLANVAFWTASVPLGQRKSERLRGDDGSRWWLRITAEMIQRLLALALTAAFVLAVITATMDVIGWQYLQRAATPSGWLSFLRWSWLNEPNRQLIVASAGPLLAVGLLWLLGRQTWAKLEGTTPTPAKPIQVLTPLEDRRMWNGQGPVARLRAVHVSCGVVMIGLALMAPLLLKSDGVGDLAGRPWGWAILLVGCSLTVLLAALVGMVCQGSMSHRDRPDTGARPRSPALYARLPYIALTLTGMAVVVLMLPGVWTSFWPRGTYGSLPGVVGAIEILFAAQAALIFLLGVVVWLLRRSAAVDPNSVVPKVNVPGALPVTISPIWHGMTPALLSTLAWLLGGGFSAALTLFVANAVGRSTQSSAAPLTVPDAILVPDPFVWAAAATFIVACGALFITIVTGVRVLRERTQLDLQVEDAYELGDQRDRAPCTATRVRSIRWSWMLGGATRFAPGAVGSLITLMFVIGAAGILGYVVARPGISRDVVSWSYEIGTIGIIAGVGVLVTLGRRVYQDPGTRRQVGILWDLGTFWPRATHPLAPPCYAERAVPDLLNRIEYYRHESTQRVPSEGLPIVLSCHSQGSAIGAATILQLTFEDSEQVGFITYGSMLRRLYARIFPAYFGARPLARLGVLTRVGGKAKDTGVAVCAHERSIWRWRNLYRPSDPIGGALFVDYPAGYEPAADVDRNLLDPTAFGRPTGDTCYPSVAGHSDYLIDPAYADAVAAIRASLALAPAAAVAGPQSSTQTSADSTDPPLREVST